MRLTEQQTSKKGPDPGGSPGVKYTAPVCKHDHFFRPPPFSLPKGLIFRPALTVLSERKATIVVLH